MAKKKGAISIDIGYGDVKVDWMDKIIKFPTAISFYTNNGITYGDSQVYDFEGEKYLVGSETTGSETFSTTDYKFLSKFAPLIIYHILKKFEIAGKDIPVRLNTGLALVDWDKKEEFVKRISKFKINDETITTDVKIVPQGVGIFMNNAKKDADIREQNATIIDIGNNTINLISMKKGKFQPHLSKSYPGHGVSSIIKPFRSYLENKFKMPFSEQEASEIASDERFTFNGEVQEEVTDFIKDEKRKFVLKLFNSVLVDDKKVIGMSETVILSGGGSYLLQKAKLPKNFRVDSAPMEFSNVKGYSLL